MNIKKRAKRVVKKRVFFKSPIPELNSFYQQIDEEIRSEIKSRLFNYEKVDDTHYLYMVDFLRFKRKSKDIKVDVEIFDKNTNTWKNCSFDYELQKNREKEESRKLRLAWKNSATQNGFFVEEDNDPDPINNNVNVFESEKMPGQAYEDFQINLFSLRNATLENNTGIKDYTPYYEYSTPMMWPIYSSSPNDMGSVTHHNGSIVGSKISKLDNLIRENKKSIMINNNLTEEEFNKKSIQLHLVLESKWSKKNRNNLNIGKKYATKIWWQHFVDRDLLKVLVSVYGNKTKNTINWVAYSAISSMPNLEELMDKISSWGPEKQRLENIDFRKWQQVKIEELIPSKWLNVWSEVSSLPPSVSNKITSFIQNEINDSRDEILSWNSTGIGYAPDPKRDLDIKTLDIWECFNDTLDEMSASYKKVRPRDMAMSFVAWELTNANPINNKKSVYGRLNVDNIKDYSNFIIRCQQIWKKVHPKGYQYWSMSEQDCWKNFISSTWMSTKVNNGEFKIGNMNNYEKYKAVDDKIQIEKTLKDNIQNPTKVKKVKKM